MEITERDVAARPAELLHTLNWVRRRGCRIALDDVGADRRVLALLPVIAPEIIKLDLQLVQQQANGPLVEIMAAVNAQAERTGVQILAEGIETGHHAFVARSLGATLGSGWMFGRPGPLPLDAPAGGGTVAAPHAHVPHGARPTPSRSLANTAMCVSGPRHC